MLPIALRLLLVIGAAFALSVVLHKVKRSKILIEDIVFWVVASFIMLILAVFPEIAIWLSSVLGFLSASNFVYLSILTLLIICAFGQAMEISRLKYKIAELAHHIALQEEQNKEAADTELDKQRD